MAVKDYNDALNISPQHAISYHNRGVAYLRLGRNGEAIKDFQAAAKLGFKGSQDYLKSKRVKW